MKVRALRLVTNRYVLIAINFLLLFISLSVIREMLHLRGNESNDSAELESMASGIAMMLYGYGVSLELRRATLTILGIALPASQIEDAVNHTCRKYGIGFVLLGLSLEVLVQLINIPSRILTIEPAEGALCAVGVFVLTVTSVLLIWFSLKLGSEGHAAR